MEPKLQLLYYLPGELLYTGDFASSFWHSKRESIFENDRWNWQERLRHQFEISNVNFSLTSISSDVKKEDFFFSFLFRQSVYFYLKRRESEKKVLTKKFSPEVSKELRKIFFRSGSIPIMSFHNFWCWSCKFSNVKQKWAFYTLNWWRNPPCQFYLSLLKIGSRVLC